MKKAWQNFIRSFQPTYKVNAITYFVIPGLPVNRNENVHHFDKGEYEQAKKFFDNVANKTQQLRFGPVEIHLIKGKKNVIEEKKFGPVDKIQDNKSLEPDMSKSGPDRYKDRDSVPSVELTGHVSPVHIFGLSRLLKFDQPGESYSGGGQ